MPFKFEAVLFDNDNTAQQTEKVAFGVVADVLNEFLKPYKKTVEALTMQKRYAGDQMPEICRHLFRELGVPFNEDDITRLAKQNKELTIPAMAEKSEATDGMLETARKLIGNGYKLALVTSSERKRVQAGLTKTGLDQFFTTLNFEGGNIFTVPDSLPYAGLPASPKPDPAICNLAVQTLRVKKHKSVAVEDSSTGVRAWVSARIPVIGYTGADPLSPSENAALTQKLNAAGAIAVINHMDELPRTLQELEVGYRKAARLQQWMMTRSSAVRS